MEIIEVEFEHYASFSNCLVPINKGVTVLVGRNNVGKTALLRGLSILNLLASPPQPSAPELLGYIEQQQPGMRFLKAAVSFRVEETDQFLEASAEWWRYFMRKNPLLTFTVLVSEQGAGFGECTLIWQGGRADILSFERNNLLLNNYATELANEEAKLIKQSSQSLSPAEFALTYPIEQRNYQRPIPKNLAVGFRGSTPVRVVEAHRAVRSKVPLHPPNDANGVNAEMLATYLVALHGRNRRKYKEIESLVTQIFPEVEYVNAEKDDNNNFSVSVTPKAGGGNIPLTHCGTGVEQILVLATFVVTSTPGSIICIDEPHSYLHPSAERELLRFLSGHSEHRYLIASHSPVVLNSVTPENVVHIRTDERGGNRLSHGMPMPDILFSVGYRNSDVFFSDRLIFVEGESGQHIVPYLLKQCGQTDPTRIDGTGFPVLGGTPGGRHRAKQLQTRIVQYEKWLRQIGTSTMPRIYFFDGDFTGDDERLLENTKLDGDAVRVRFLPRRELENYLLVPDAISRYLRDQAGELNEQATVSPEDIERQIAQFLELENNEGLYPDGRRTEAIRDVKGSEVLKRLFGQYNLPYSKTATGTRIASYITAENQPALLDFWQAVADIFF